MLLQNDTYRSLEHIGESHASASQLEHIVLEDEVVLPLLLQVTLKGRAERSVIVHACDTSINLERLDEEEFTLKQVFHFFTHVLL